MKVTFKPSKESRSSNVLIKKDSDSSELIASIIIKVINSLLYVPLTAAPSSFLIRI
jgi:hypothetical protein